MNDTDASAPDGLEDMPTELELPARTVTPPPFGDTDRTDTPSRPYVPPSEGADFGCRFTLERRLAAGPSGIVFRAKDGQTRRTVLLRIVPPELVAAIGVDALDRAIFSSRGLKAKGVARVYGMKADGPARYIVSEWVEGQPLSDLAAARRKAERPFTALGAYNIVGNVLLALQAGHVAGVWHGDLRPQNVFIDTQGRVKVADFAVGELFTPSRLLATERRTAYDPPEPVRDKRSDLRNAMLLFAELYSGKPARVAVEALPPAVKALVAPWQAANPASRPALDAGALRTQLQQAVGGVRGSAAVPPEPTPAAGAARRAPSPGPPPRPPTRASAAVRPPARPPEATGGHPAAPPAVLPGRSAALFREVLDKIGAPRAPAEELWLAQKGGLDYGPFSAEELMDRVRAGEFDEDAQLQQLATGRTAKLREFESFEQHLSRFFAERKARAAVDEATRAARVKTAKKAGKGVFAAGFLGGSAVVAFLLWVFLHTPLPKPLAYAEVTMSFGGAVPEPALDAVEELARARYKAVRKRQRRAQRRAMMEVVDTYDGGAPDDDGISRVDMSDDDGGAGGAPAWNQARVDGVLAGAHGALGACMRKELKRNPEIGRTVLSFKIAPSGAAKAVRVEGKSTKLLGQCMVDTVTGLRFPAFDGFDRTVTLPFDVAR